MQTVSLPHTRRADTHKTAGPNNLKMQTEYKYLKPVLPNAAADTVSVLILTPTIASLSPTLSPCLRNVCAAIANSTSAQHSHPTQNCRELYTSWAYTHIYTRLQNRASSRPHRGKKLPRCFLLAFFYWHQSLYTEDALNCFVSSSFQTVRPTYTLYQSCMA